MQFSKNQGMNEGEGNIEGQEIPKSEQFRYLGSIMHTGDIGADVTRRIKAGWTKWRNASDVLCDRRISLRLKEKFYKMIIRLTMLYGTECWAVKKQYVSKMNIAEMRMLRWMCGKTIRDKIKNEHIRKMIEEHQSKKK